MRRLIRSPGIEANRRFRRATTPPAVMPGGLISSLAPVAGLALRESAGGAAAAAARQGRQELIEYRVEES